MVKDTGLSMLSATTSVLVLVPGEALKKVIKCDYKTTL